MNGDAVDEESVEDSNFDFPKWISKHGPDSWGPVLDKTVAALKEQGVTRFGTTAYCFGGPAAFYLTFKGDAHVNVIAHPTAMTVSDFEVRDDCYRVDARDTNVSLYVQKYKTNATAPLLINSCEFDELFPPELQAKADEVLGDGKFTPGYERLYWEGCTHGFAVRGDMVGNHTLSHLPTYLFVKNRARVTPRRRQEWRVPLRHPYNFSRNIYKLKS